jgi:hypothetical protein
MGFARAFGLLAGVIGASLATAGTAGAQPDEVAELLASEAFTRSVFQRNLERGAEQGREYKRIRLRYDRPLDVGERDVVLRLKAPLKRRSLLKLELLF